MESAVPSSGSVQKLFGPLKAELSGVAMTSPVGRRHVWSVNARRHSSPACGGF